MTFFNRESGFGGEAGFDRKPGSGRQSARVALGALALAALVLPAAAEAETFTMWVRSDGSNFMPKLVDAFNKSHDDKVALQIVPTTELVQKYAVASAGGSAPDALSLDLVYTPAFAAAGQLEDLSDLAKSLPYFDSLSKAHIAVGTYDGRLYGLPLAAEASVLIWNKKLFARAGLDPEKTPSNWADIRADAEKVNALGGDVHGFYFSGNCSGCTAFTFAPLVWASGGEIFIDDGKKVTLDTPEMRDAVAFYQGMVKAKLVPAGSQTDTGANFFAAFAAGNIGLAPSGAFAIGALNTQYPDVDYGVTFLPGKTGGRSSFAGGDNFVVSKGSAKLGPIKAFLEYAYSLEGQTLLAANGSLPVRADLAKDALKDLDPRYLVAAEAMANGRTPYSTVYNDILNSSNGPWITTLNQLFFGEPDAVGPGLEAAQSTIQSIIDTAQ